MERSKFSEAQVAFILRHADEGASVGEVRRKAGDFRGDPLCPAQEVCGPSAFRD